MLTGGLTEHMPSRGMHAACNACTNEVMLTESWLQQLVCTHAYAHTYMHVCVHTRLGVQTRYLRTYTHGHSCVHTSTCIRPHMSMQTCKFTRTSAHVPCVLDGPSPTPAPTPPLSAATLGEA